ATSARVVLVGLDDRSLRDAGKPAAFLSPELAEVVTLLKARGAAAIGLDLIVDESLQDSPDFARLLGAEKLGQAVVDAGNVGLARRRVREPGEPERWLLPLAAWRLKSLGDDASPTDLGFVDISPDRDHFHRRQQLFGPEGDLHFALALHAVATGEAVRWERG